MYALPHSVSNRKCALLTFGHSSRTYGRVLLVVLFLLLVRPAHATVLDWLGIGLSDTQVYKDVLTWIDPLTGKEVEAFKPGIPPKRAGLIVVAVRTLVQVIDPVLASSLISGQITFAFDPSETVTAAGWYGQFGADPSLPAPPIGADPDITLLQTAANPAMQSSSISINQANGSAVFDFNWGPAGFVPTANMDVNGHFNFLALYLAPEPGTSSSHIVSDSTFLVCASPDGLSQGSCGVTSIPEPSTSDLFAAGFFLFGLSRCTWKPALLILRRRPGRPCSI